MRGCLSGKCGRCAEQCNEYGNTPVDQIPDQGRQSIVAPLNPAVLNLCVLPLNIAGFAQPLAEGGRPPGLSPKSPIYPITGFAGCRCCARAAIGHAAVLPSPAMNVLRLIE